MEELKVGTSLKQKNFLGMVEYKLLSLSESKQERDADGFRGGNLELVGSEGS